MLMVMVAFVAALNANNLKNVTLWRRHTTEVIRTQGSRMGPVRPAPKNLRRMSGTTPIAQNLPTLHSSCRLDFRFGSGDFSQPNDESSFAA
jgi:hypothetical protein